MIRVRSFTFPMGFLSTVVRLTQGLAVTFANPPSLELEVTTPSALSMPFLPERAHWNRGGVDHSK